MVRAEDADATDIQIRDLATRAASAAQPDGTLWFVFTGHGAPSGDGGRLWQDIATDNQGDTVTIRADGATPRFRVDGPAPWASSIPRRRPAAPQPAQPDRDH